MQPQRSFVRRALAPAILALGILASTTACTPRQVVAWYWIAKNQGQAQADAVVNQYNAEKAAQLAVWPECGDHYDEAISGGFQPVEWPTLSTIMGRETGHTCRNDLIGPFGERGAMQIYPRVWLSRLCALGIACTPEELAAPEANLAAAKYVKDTQGWRAWTTCRSSCP
jgi:hypothetical protein